MNEMSNPVIMQFPLRGEWLSPNTPGSKIPSHGTNKFGTRYAYDFIQVDWKRKGLPAYRAGLPRYLIAGLPLKDYYCWGQPVYAPCSGLVVKAADGFQERPRTFIAADIYRAYKNARFFNPEKDDAQSIAGNHIIIKYSDHVYAALCHLQTNSIEVSAGQTVRPGEMLGRVGHSGNSFAPHLHFQLMDSDDIRIANGLPCAFEQYEVYRGSKWICTADGIPAKTDRIRHI